MYKYTICFIKQGDKVLLLNRNKPPVMGLWHGVGGKIESGEAPEESVLREIYEETGIRVEEVAYKGIVSWNGAGRGMHTFFAELPESFEYSTPKLTNEGILDWKDLTWVFNPNNNGIPAHVTRFLPYVLRDAACYEHRCIFEDGRLVECKPIPLDCRQAPAAQAVFS